MTAIPKLKKELKTAKILAIDDDEWFLRLLIKKFEDVDPGFIITPAYSADQAIELLNKESYDCILCDHKLPGTIKIKGKVFPSDGIHLLRKFTDDLKIDTPVIFVTGQGSEEIASQALLEGASGYFIKRVQPGYYSLMATSIRQTIDRYWIQRQLQKSESRYRDLFENSAGLIFITDNQGTLIESNNNFMTLYGYTADEIKGLSYEILAYHEDIEKWTEMINSINEGRIENRMLRSVTIDDQIIHLDITARPIYGKKTDKVTGIQAIARDITNQIKTQQALIDSEEKHRKIVEGASEGLIIMDKDGIILDWNRAATDITGFTRDYTIGKNLLEIMQKLNPSPLDKDNVKFDIYSAFKKIIRQDEGISADFLIKYQIKNIKNNSNKILESIGFIIEHSKGNRVAMVLKDITKYYLAEERTRSIAKQFRTLIEGTPIGVWVADVKDEKTTYVNTSVANLLGYSPEEMIGISVLDFVAPEYVDKIKEITRKRLAKEPTEQTYEVDFFHRTGIRISTLITGAAIRSDDGKLEQTFGFIRDVTDEKVREREFRVTKEFLESVIASIQSGLYSYDLKYKITLANPRLAEILEYSSHNQLIGKNIFDILPNYEHKRIKDLTNAILNGTNHEKYLFLTYVTKTGEEKKASVTSAPLMQDDKVEGFLVTVKDITEQRRLEKLLNRIQNEFQKLADNIPNGLIKIDNLGHVIFYNEKASEILTKTGINELHSLNVLHNQLFIDNGLHEKFRDIIYQKYSETDIIIRTFLSDVNNNKIELKMTPIPIYDTIEPKIISWFILMDLDNQIS